MGGQRTPEALSTAAGPTLPGDPAHATSQRGRDGAPALWLAAGFAPVASSDAQFPELRQGGP
eukprot:13718699-Alexandrium_andersonii.AAC.1